MDEQNKKTKKLRKASGIIVIISGLLWAIYDIFPSINPGRGDTISENIRDWSRSLWTLPFLFGALSSHFFLNFGQPAKYQTQFYILVGIFVVITAVNVLTALVWKIEASATVRAGMLFLGMIAGALLWRQNP